MTPLAGIDGALRRPELAPLDRVRLLAVRRQVLDRLQDAQQPNADNAPSLIPSLPDGPEGEE